MQIPVALTDSRLIEQHAAEIADYESQLGELSADRDALEGARGPGPKMREDAEKDVAAARAETEAAFADKARLLKNYEGALDKIESKGIAKPK